MRNKFIIVLLMLPFSTGYADDPVQEGRISLYEGVLRDYEGRYPRELDRGDSVYKWWPLDATPEYRYRITHSQNHPEWIDREFTLRILQDGQIANRFIFDVSGFDDFPYKGLEVRGNRLFTIFKEGMDSPLIMFPMFPGMIFADEKYELQFLRQLIREQTHDTVFGPVNTQFRQVEEVKDAVYTVRHWSPRGTTYVFQKGFGMLIWQLSIGMEIEIVEDEAEGEP